MSAPDRKGLRGWAGRIAPVVGMLVITGIGLYAIGYGGYVLWVQHSGTPAQVKLDKCKKNGRRAHGYTCTAVWQPSGEPPRTVTVRGPETSARRTVNVHVRGDQAFTDSYDVWPPIAVGIAMVAVWPVILLIVRRRRRYASP